MSVAQAWYFHDGDRVQVTDITDRLYNESGIVDGWYWGMSGKRVYLVEMDMWDDRLPFLQEQLGYESEG